MTTTAPATSMINFRPMMRNQKRSAWRKVHYDNAVKIVLVFETPFWEKLGYVGGKIISDSPLRATFFPSHEYESGVGVLLASYVWGDDANLWTAYSDEQAVDKALEEVVKILGDEAKTQFLEGRVKNWLKDDLSMGAYCWLLPHQQVQENP